VLEGNILILLQFQPKVARGLPSEMIYGRDLPATVADP
jgi:hypothetical protein